MRSYTSKLQSLKSSLDVKIRIGEENNKRKEKMEDKRDRIISATNYLKDQLDLTTEMLVEINSVLKSSQESKKRFLEEEIRTALDCVFKENYNVLFDVRPYKDSYRADLKLFTESDGQITYLNANTQNGGLCRQVISLSAGFALAKLMDCHMFFMDEALNGGDSDSLRKMQPIIKSYLDYHPDNVIILNEHNLSLCQDLPCRIFNLHKEGCGLEGYVVIDEIVDQESNNMSEVLLQ